MIFLYITYPCLYVQILCPATSLTCAKAVGYLVCKLHITAYKSYATHCWHCTLRTYVRHCYSCTNMRSRRVLDKSYIGTCFNGLICASGVLSNCLPNVAFVPNIPSLFHVCVSHSLQAQLIQICRYIHTYRVHIHYLCVNHTVPFSLAPDVTCYQLTVKFLHFTCDSFLSAAIQSPELSCLLQ